jgi:putative endonuclease
MLTRQPTVYILASERNSVLYIGVTRDLIKRAWQHKKNATKGFTYQYNVKRLVYFELFNDMYNAIKRENSSRRGIEVGKFD